MIRFATESMVVIGFTHDDLEKLKAGHGSQTNLKDFGGPDMELFIVSGKDNQAMIDKFGLLSRPEKTVFIDRRKKHD